LNQGHHDYYVCVLKFGWHGVESESGHSKLGRRLQLSSLVGWQVLAQIPKRWSQSSQGIVSDDETETGTIQKLHQSGTDDDTMIPKVLKGSASGGTRRLPARLRRSSRIPGTPTPPPAPTNPEHSPPPPKKNPFLSLLDPLVLPTAASAKQHHAARRQHFFMSQPAARRSRWHHLPSTGQP
jgi:hypothetical protein